MYVLFLRTCKKAWQNHPAFFLTYYNATITTAPNIHEVSNKTKIYQYTVDSITLQIQLCFIIKSAQKIIKKSKVIESVIFLGEFYDFKQTVSFGINVSTGNHNYDCNNSENCHKTCRLYKVLVLHS